MVDIKQALAHAQQSVLRAETSTKLMRHLKQLTPEQVRELQERMAKRKEAHE